MMDIISADTARKIAFTSKDKDQDKQFRTIMFKIKEAIEIAELSIKWNESMYIVNMIHLVELKYIVVETGHNNYLIKW